jgi:molybdopterin molybdotransferase
MPQIFTLEEAFERLLSLRRSPRTQTIPIDHARGRVAAEDIIAQVDVPPFPRAMMDGYAVRAEDAAERGRSLRRVGRIIAGDVSQLRVGPGEAVRIMTGAPVPTGADSVIRFEWCEEQGDDEVQVLHPVTVGESVQPRGEDGCAGQRIIRAGTRLAGAQLAVCRAFGVRNVAVAASPVVAIIVTGSELQVYSDQPLQPGQIYSTNATFLSAAIESDGGTVACVQHVPDDPGAIRYAIQRGLESADYVLLSGGVSSGDADHVPTVLRQLGAHPVLEKVWMRPGSTLLAARLGNAAVFALSGNPAACFIQFEVLVRPVLRRSLGWMDTPFPSSGQMAHPLTLKPVKHTRVLRAIGRIEEGSVWVDTTRAQSPGVISNLADSNCLVCIDDAQAEKGSVVPLRWLDFPR